MSVTETMTIHRALAEKKILDKRIQTKIAELEIGLAIEAGKADKPEAIKLAAAQADNLKSIMDLIARFTAIDRAIAESNSRTIVKIGNEEMTVLAAIKMKEKFYSYITELKSRISSTYFGATRNAERTTQNAEKTALTLVNARNTSSLSEEDLLIYNQYIVQHSGTVVVSAEVGDVPALIKKLEALEDMIVGEIDAALSVSNATTSIEITYEPGKILA